MTAQAEPRPSTGRRLREVVFVDGVRTPFGKAGPTGRVRRDPRRRPGRAHASASCCAATRQLPPERIGEVAIAATTQTGDQGMTIGRNAALLAGLPEVGARLRHRPDVRRRHDRRHHDRRAASPSARTTSWSPAASSTWATTRSARAWTPTRASSSERLVDPSALVMGATAENLHDRYPQLTKERADAYAVASQHKYAKALRRGPDPGRPGRGRRPHRPSAGWGLATADEQPRPDSTRRGPGGAAHAVPPARPHHRRQRRRPQRRRHRLPARRRGRRRASSACRSGCAWSRTASPASSPR